MLSNLKSVFEKYDKKCVLAFNVFGFEDAISIVRAAEDTNNPVILMTNSVATSHMPILLLAGILKPLAEQSSTDVVVHLDHAKDWESIKEAVDVGYSSVMYDGSHLPLQENIENTCNVIEYANRFNVSVEGEIGAVGYSHNEDLEGLSLTDIDEATKFYKSTNVDALAVAIGNLHRMTSQEAVLNFDLLKKIHSNISAPLVIHGASGIKDEDIVRLRENGVRKINIGTSLRQVFGNSLRNVIESDPCLFDRIDMFKPAMDAVYREVKNKFKLV